MSELLLDRESLKTNGYMAVPVDMSKSDYDAVQDSYAEFLELPEEYQELTQYNAGGIAEYDFGQFKRSKGSTNHFRGIVQDNKDIFHGGAKTRQVVEARVSGPLPKALKTFINNVVGVYWCGERAVKIGLEYLDTENVGLANVILDDRHEPTSTVRIIHYRPTDEPVLAKAHYDRDECTVTLGESHSGLRIAPGQNKRVVKMTSEYMEALRDRLTPVEYKEYEGKLFLGARWNCLPVRYRRGNEDLQLGYHDVVKTKQIVTDTIMRSAIVFFANPHLGFGDNTSPTPEETRPEKGMSWLIVPKAELIRV